jgi:hypothetical protein
MTGDTSDSSFGQIKRLLLTIGRTANAYTNPVRIYLMRGVFKTLTQNILGLRLSPSLLFNGTKIKNIH